MQPLNYDLHIHSCLSPCADDDMTPGNIVGMAALKNLDVIAITDHNSCRNCEVAMRLGKEANIVVLPGMELTTAEEVHVLCLFAELEHAMEFDAYVYEQLIKVFNNENIFGTQWVVDEEDEIVAIEPYLMINATHISFQSVYDVVTRLQGVMIPAHLDKNSNSVISNLGFIPPDVKFTCIEVKEMSKLHKLQKDNPYLYRCNTITNSDAHSLWQLNEVGNVLYATSKKPNDILSSLAQVTFL